MLHIRGKAVLVIPSVSIMMWILALGRGRMLESLSFNTGYAGPIIHIMRASYGNFKDGTKVSGHHH